MITIETIEQLAKRRGFFWQSLEIYGGLGGFYDYGHLGTLMKRKLENLWRNYFLGLDDNFFEIEPSHIMHEKVFEASGHLKHFVDPIAKCKKCETIHRADHILEDFLKESFEGLTVDEMNEIIKKHKIKCPKCKGELKVTGFFNMMFPLFIGPEQNIKSYLPPETAQGSYVNFLQEFEVSRKKLPLGLAIIGRAYRNEISPRQLLIRMREFSQAELQIFFDSEKINEHKKWNEVKNYKLILYPTTKKLIELTCEDAVNKLKLPKFYIYYMAKVQQFFLEKLLIPREKFRLKELSEEERAFYNKIHWDIEFDLSSIGWKEIGGVHYRTDYDLKGHQKVSKKSQEIFFNNKKFIPHVLELSFGIDRIIFGLIDLNYKETKDRIILQLPNSISPFIAGVFPLVNKGNLDKKAEGVYDLLKEDFDVFYDDSGSIGRRYARADETGVPFAITIDYDTMKDNTVTLRNRDTTQQERIKISELVEFLNERLNI